MSRSSPVIGSQQIIQSSPPRRAEILLKCACGLDAVRLVSGQDGSFGRVYHKCAITKKNNKSGCNLFKWEDQISGPSVRASPQTPSSSQPRSQPSSQPMTPAHAQLNSSQTWTSSVAIHPSSVTTRNKRKRSSSPLPGPPTTPSVTRSGSTATPNTRRSAILAALTRDASNVTGTSVVPDYKPDDKPAEKRVKRDDTYMDAFSHDDIFWPPMPSQGLFLAGLEEDHDIPSAQVSSRKAVLTLMRDGTTGEISVARKLDFTSMRPATQDRPVLEHDPSNPFIVSPSPPMNETGIAPATPVPTPATTEPLAVISQLEVLLPQLVSVLPDLKRQVTVLERKKTADARSVEAKLRRIKALEEENERLKKENKWLKDRP